MERVGSNLESITDVNRKLAALLATLRPSPSSFCLAGEKMTAIFAELIRAAALLEHGLAHDREPQVQQQLDHYRTHLEQLREWLPGIHLQLLTERSQIQAERDHLAAAAAWARSTGKQAL